MKKTLPSDPPHRTIIAFFQDEEAHWAARLSCGHGRHMRHRPPMEDRPWVLDPHKRGEVIGQELPCFKCRDGEPIDLT